jgi:hypothetical protein
LGAGLRRTLVLAILLVSAGFLFPACLGSDSANRTGVQDPAAGLSKVTAGDVGLTISTQQPPLLAGTDYTFVAHSLHPESLSENPQYEWDFGDGTTVGIPYVNQAIHTFDKEGQYTIRVEVFESGNAGAVSLGVATAKVTVEANDAPDIELTIEVSSTPPFETGCQINFEAVSNVANRQLPENIRWEWYWGDGGEDKRDGQPHVNKSGNWIQHAYRLNGSFTVLVQLFDSDTDDLLAAANKDVSIDNVAAIQRTHEVRVWVWAFKFQDISRLQNGAWEKTGSWNLHTSTGGTNEGLGDVEWKGNEVSWVYRLVDGTQTSTYTISGRVSADASVLETITVAEDHADPDKNKTRREVLTLTDVPLEKRNCGDDVVFRATLSGADAVRQLLTHYEYESKTPEEVQRHTGFDWDYLAQETKLEVVFSALK